MQAAHAQHVPSSATCSTAEVEVRTAGGAAVGVAAVLAVAALLLWRRHRRLGYVADSCPGSSPAKEPPSPSYNGTAAGGSPGGPVYKQGLDYSAESLVQQRSQNRRSQTKTPVGLLSWRSTHSAEVNRYPWSAALSA